MVGTSTSLHFPLFLSFFRSIFIASPFLFLLLLRASQLDADDDKKGERRFKNIKGKERFEYSNLAKGF